ncbi:hypothetical protein TNCV_4649681 [Trichonephila clavipes]|uniref:Phosphoglycerate mutase n=1 Tax=Trichonephila clavipes TaxID=2585209 RepID=A0A8X6SY74_TRICX|nr:hypothetical protein TNCV_4649681 [Trichonephila clavipes]
MNVYEYIVLLRHGSTRNNHLATSPLMGLVEGKERWKALDHFKVLSLKIGMEPSQIVLSPEWCSWLRLTTGVHLAYCYGKFEDLDPRPSDRWH